MNNNMPNNFNNGAQNNSANNQSINNFGGVTAQANEKLVGGQSAAGNGPSVMQGIPNAQNDRGVMQGVSNVPNTPGIMQGNVTPNKPDVPPIMPGQNHSGINAFTMQKEEPRQESPEVVSIPNFAPNIPEAPKPQPQPATAPAPQPVQTPNPINNVGPNMNLSQNIGNSLNNNPFVTLSI